GSFAPKNAPPRSRWFFWGPNSPPAGAAPRLGSDPKGGARAVQPHPAPRRGPLITSPMLFAPACLPTAVRPRGGGARPPPIVLRGALDGLAAVAPVGDPDWVALRGDKALTLDGKPAALPLDAFFALNPAMPNLHRLYKSGAATIVHATATPYRERSHFDGQD